MLNVKQELAMFINSPAYFIFLVRLLDLQENYEEVEKLLETIQHSNQQNDVFRLYTEALDKHIAATEAFSDAVKIHEQLIQCLNTSELN